MGRIEKTVFISYRRTNYWTALAIYQNLNANGIDVFLDYKNIPSGDFEQVITENVKSCAHFIVILSPSALERCNEPRDWLRREIETAIDNKRNIIPLIMEGFEFGSSTTIKALTGKLADLRKYNAIGIPAEYFEDAMIKLRSEKFLNRPLESVFHPVSNITKQITEKQKSTANRAAPVEQEQLTAQEWFERGYFYGESKNYDDAIRCYTEVIRLEPKSAESYSNRGLAFSAKGNLESAINDFENAIRINSKDSDYFGNIGYAIIEGNGNLDQALKFLNTAIKLNSNNAIFYNNRGRIYYRKQEYKKSCQRLRYGYKTKSKLRTSLQESSNYSPD